MKLFLENEGFSVELSEEKSIVLEAIRLRKWVVDAKKTLQSAQTTLVMTNAAKNQLKKEIRQVLSSSSS